MILNEKDNIVEAEFTPAYVGEDVLVEQALAQAITHSNPTTQLFLRSKLATHTPEAGVNPLVDAAAYLFSVIGKLKHLKSYRDLAKLHHELVYEIEVFQENAKSSYHNNNYISEYLPITSFALCATLDDIISATPWGGEAWQAYSLLETFYQDSISYEGFFIILERLIRDPEIYIDIMEFMYFCLSLGFKGQYRFSTNDQEKLEHVINVLYKRIRFYRGEFSKTLSPHLIKNKILAANATTKVSMPDWVVILLFSGLIILLFTGVRYLFGLTF